VTGLRRSDSRSFGLVLAGAGLALIALVEVCQPVFGPGLYDGVVPEEPYRVLNPATDQAGSPSSAQVTLDASGGTSPAIVLVTTEQPPQAQLIATPGAISVVPGSSTLTASVAPVEASPEQAAAAMIYGNVYRYIVVDQAGNALSLAPGARPTVVLRAPFGSPAVSIAHWDGHSWGALPTGTGALPTILIAPVTELGDYALIPTGGGLALPAVIGLAILVLGIVGVLLLWWRRPRPRGGGRRGGDRT
jgi:hypothetical protein